MHGAQGERFEMLLDFVVNVFRQVSALQKSGKRVDAYWFLKLFDDLSQRLHETWHGLPRLGFTLDGYQDYLCCGERVDCHEPQVRRTIDDDVVESVLAQFLDRHLQAVLAIELAQEVYVQRGEP